MRSTRRSGATARRSPSHCAPDGGISVHDRGRGIPVDIEPRTGLSGVEVVFTKLHAGGKFGAGSLQRDRWTARRRLLGRQRLVEPARRRGGSQLRHVGHVVPARRSRDLRRARTDGKVHARRQPSAKVGRVAKGTTGTRVTYWPDRQIFLHDAQLSLRDLEDRARQTSFLVPGLALHVVDARAPRRHRGDLSAQRRDLGVLRVSRDRSTRSQTSSGFTGPIDLPKPFRCWTTRATWSPPTSSGIWRSTSPFAGATATTRALSRL